MGQNFIACDREQSLLLPPSLLDWVAEDHFVWTILDAVEELDLGSVYEAYRADGHGRPAYEPSMMVALLLYAYALGNRSSRGIERRCREDVAYMVITAMRTPDHSTIADFRKRHEAALAGLFTDVLGLCAKAGLAKVGVVAIDGTKLSANASMQANRSFEQISREILEDAAQSDEREDEQFGETRGDELPEPLRSHDGRRRALREAKRELEREREHQPQPDADSGGDDDGGGSLVSLDSQEIVERVQGRRGWLREPRKQLDHKREQEARPIARSRPERLRECARRLDEEYWAEQEANDAYEAYRERGVMKDGRRFGGPPKPYQPPEVPAGSINTSDPDSRIVRTQGQPPKQGYNAQAAVNENQIIVAAEVTIDSPDFGHVQPMVEAVMRELQAAGVMDSPETVVADAGYWHTRQIESVVSQGIQVLIPPDSGLRKEPRPGWDNGLYAFMRRVLASDHGQAVYRKRIATIEPVLGQIKHNRGFRQFLRRGRSAARCEWRLTAMPHNLLKLHSHQLAAARA